jgi:predicted nuclease with TOPRIM domain
MAKRRLSYEELKERVDELEDENQALNEKIDSIMDIVSSDDDEEDEDEN